MSNIQTGAERMPHDLSHLGFLAGQIGRLITISTTPVIAGDSFEDRKSGSAGMPRPISYAVFCLKKKTLPLQRNEERVAGRPKTRPSDRPTTSAIAGRPLCARPH